MKRRTFIKSLVGGIGAAIVAPLDLPKKECVAVEKELKPIDLIDNEIPDWDSPLAHHEYSNAVLCSKSIGQAIKKFAKATMRKREREMARAFNNALTYSR